MRTLALVLAVTAALHALRAQAQYPVLGAAPTELPAGAVALTHHGSRYYFADGAWYQQVVAGFVVVTPPAGIAVARLPPDSSVLNVSGVPLFRANNVYYAASPGGYTVVPAPQASWYYCDSMRGYYPAVVQCAEGWSLLSATPPQLR